MALAISKKSIWVKILVVLCAVALLAIFVLPPRTHAVVALAGAAAFTAAMLLWLGFSASSGASLHEVAIQITNGFSQSVKDLLDSGTSVSNGTLSIDPSTIVDSRFYSIVDDIETSARGNDFLTPPDEHGTVETVNPWGYANYSYLVGNTCIIGTYSFTVSEADTMIAHPYQGNTYVEFSSDSTILARTVPLANSGYNITIESVGVKTYDGLSVNIGRFKIPNPWGSNSAYNVPYLGLSDLGYRSWLAYYEGSYNPGGSIDMLDVGTITAHALADAMVNTAGSGTPISVPLNAVPDLAATLNGSDVPLTGSQAEAVTPSSFASSLDTPLEIENHNIFQNIWDWLKSFWANLSSTISSAISGVVDGVNSIVEAIEAILEAVANPFAEFFTNFLPSFWTTLVGTISGSLLNFASIWHYVVSWVSSLGSGFALIRSVWAGLPYAMVVPIYASIVIVIVFFVFKRIFF